MQEGLTTASLCMRARSSQDRIAGTPTRNPRTAPALTIESERKAIQAPQRHSVRCSRPGIQTDGPVSHKGRNALGRTRRLEG